MSWPVVKLGDVSEKVDYGLTASAIEKSDGPRFLRITDLQNDSVEWDEVPSCDCTPKEFEANKLAVGDIVFARTGATTGKSFLIRNLPKPSVFASYLIRVRPDASVDSGYLSHFFKSPIYWNQIINMANGAAQPGVNSSKLKELEIPLPPLAEQKRIAAILDKADAIRRKRQQAIQLADDFLRAVFLEMFGDPVTNPKGWEVKPLGQNIVHANNGLSRRRKEQENVGEIVLRLQDVHYGGIRFDNELNRIRLDPSEKERFRVDNGDILFIRVNGNPDYVGRSAVFEGYDEDIYHNDHLIRLKTSDAYDPIFLSYCFNFEGGRKIISRQIKTSAGQHTISQGGIALLDFYVPPVDLQRKFVRIKNSVMNISFDDVTTNVLFDSLSQKAFSGQL